MAYYASNEPYNRQDSVLNGMITGAMTGTAGVGATQLAMFNRAGGQFRKSFQRTNQPLALNSPPPGTPEGRTVQGIKNPDAYKGKTSPNYYDNIRKSPSMNGKYGRFFGTGKSKLISYGVGATAGSLLGMGIDAIND